MQPCGRLTTPPQDEVELVTNSAYSFLPEDTRLASPVRSAILDKFFLNKFLARASVPPGGGPWNAGGLLSVLNSPPVFAAHSLSAPGRFAS